jgi:hypothetical protein
VSPRRTPAGPAKGDVIDAMPFGRLSVSVREPCLRTSGERCEEPNPTRNAEDASNAQSAARGCVRVASAMAAAAKHVAPITKARNCYT